MPLNLPAPPRANRETGGTRRRAPLAQPVVVVRLAGGDQANSSGGDPSETDGEAHPPPMAAKAPGTTAPALATGANSCGGFSGTSRFGRLSSLPLRSVAILGIALLVLTVAHIRIVERVPTHAVDLNSDPLSGHIVSSSSSSSSLSSSSTRRSDLARGSPLALRIYTDETTGLVAACRIPRACVRRADPNRTIDVPLALQPLAQALIEHCNIPSYRIAFYAQNDRHIRSAASTADYPDTHLLGYGPLRHHIPHFLDDFVRNVMSVTPFLQRPSRGRWDPHAPPFSPPNVSVQCLEPGGRPANASGHLCGSEPPRAIGVLVEDKAAALSWAPGFFSLLGAPASGTQLDPLYRDVIFHATAPQAGSEASPKAASAEQGERGTDRACFASVTFNVFARSLNPDLFEQHHLFDHSDFQRRIPALQSAAQRDSMPCELNVTILNRPLNPPHAGFPMGARSIVNIKQLVDELHGEAQKQKVVLRLIVREDFGSASFLDQVREMQHTQILISVHGAELSNSFFLRRGATVVEIYPFRYTTDIFENYIRQFGLHYLMHIAKPDTKTYKRCIEYFNNPKERSREASQRNLAQFEAQAVKYMAARDRKEQEDLGHFWDSGDDVFMKRACARSQRLTIDARWVAMKALQRHRETCRGML
jgi:Glycosyltransferase 61